MVKFNRLEAEQRRELLISTALKLSQERDFRLVKLVDIANAAGVTKGLVAHYFGSSETLADRIMEVAIEAGCHAVVAQGLFCDHPAALGAPVTTLRTARLLLAEKMVGGAK